MRHFRHILLTLIITGFVSNAFAQNQKQFLLGGDISALTTLEKHGAVFKNSSGPADAIRIMTEHGANCFRLRLFVNPTNRNVVTNDLKYTIALAKRIKAANAKFLLNFHYSDTWADPAHQTKPRAWKDLDFDAMEKEIYDYTLRCVKEFKNANVLPDMIQPGNEITNGFLWPDAKLYGEGNSEEKWTKFTRLLKAATRAIKHATPDQNIPILLHVDKGGSWPQTKYFFDRIEKHNVPYDIIALSYYPWWHGTIDQLKTNLKNCSSTFQKDIFLVETAYPHKQMKFSNAKPDSLRWPMTPTGQKEFLEELIFVVKNTPNNRGIGVLWWYPEAIPTEGIHVWNGGKTALFDKNGAPLPSMQAFSR